MLHWLHKPKLTYKTKLILTFVLVAFLPSLVMQYVTYVNSTRAVRMKINELVNYNLIQTNKNVNATLADYEGTLNQLMINDDFIKSTYKMIHGSDLDRFYYSDVVQRLFSGFTNSMDGIRGFTFFDTNGNIIDSYDKTTGSYLWSQEKNNIPFLLIMKLNGINRDPLITDTERMNEDGSGSSYVFHIARRVFGTSSDHLEKLGYIVMTLEESVLSNACSISLTETQPQGISNVNMIIDAANRIVSFPDKTKIGSNFDDILGGTVPIKGPIPGRGSVLGQPSILNDYPNEQTGWTIVNITSEKKMFGEMYAMQKIDIWSGVLLFLFSTLLIVYLSGLLTKSIHKILYAMRLTERGNLDVRIEMDEGDEIAVIASSYNKMMATIKDLMEQTKRATQKQKESEIRSLEAQINPHFLYNTLDSINWMAIEKEEHEISRMLKGLAMILRYSISHSNQMVPLAQELMWLEQYLFLQKSRFNDAFQYFVHMDPRLQEAKVYKLLLQPFVENTILHGFSGIKAGAELHIHFYIGDQGCLCIEMKDNGCGIDEATVTKILERSAERPAGAGTGIGIRNVIERLHLYYGDSAHCRIESAIGQGTKVILMLPTAVEVREEGIG